MFSMFEINMTSRSYIHVLIRHIPTYRCLQFYLLIVSSTEIRTYNEISLGPASYVGANYRGNKLSSVLLCSLIYREIFDFMNKLKQNTW